ncbi:MAG: response regulator transcription factor [Planctomycetota bacterium]
MSTPQRDAGGAAPGGLCCVVVEDQTMFLQLLVGMLRTIPGIQLAAVAQGVREAVDTCRNLPVDLLLLDLVLPDGDGLDVLRDVVTRRPDVDCIVLSSAAAEFSCPQALLPHLRGVVDKTQTYERLATVIEDVVRSRGAIPAGERSASPDPRSVLRPREFEIFQLIGQGLKTLEISRRLGISANTVETHRKNLASKLNASGAELVRFAAIYNQTALPRSEPR